MGYLTLFGCVPAPSARTSAKSAARPPAARTVDPQVVAREAVARLRLTAPKPAVGPPPSINKWKMAAVGYPLWLWVEGDTDPAPVTDTSGPLSVSLDARVTGIGFDAEQTSNNP